MKSHDPSSATVTIRLSFTVCSKIEVLHSHGGLPNSAHRRITLSVSDAPATVLQLYRNQGAAVPAKSPRQKKGHDLFAAPFFHTHWWNPRGKRRCAPASELVSPERLVQIRARADTRHRTELHELLQQLKDEVMSHLELLMHRVDIKVPHDLSPSIASSSSAKQRASHTITAFAKPFMRTITTTLLPLHVHSIPSL